MPCVGHQRLLILLYRILHEVCSSTKCLLLSHDDGALRYANLFYLCLYLEEDFDKESAHPMFSPPLPLRDCPLSDTLCHFLAED